MTGGTLGPDEVAPLLTTRFVGRALRHFAVCGSTSDEAARWAREGAPAGALVLAEEQQGGRGRLGRVWRSPAYQNLYFSTVLRPAIAPRHAPPITLAVAVALAETAERFGARAELKWPNDLLLDGKKAAGILTEMTCAGQRLDFVVVGIGVNLNQRSFEGELEGRATSLALATGNDIDRPAFAAALCERLEEWHDRFVEGGLADVIREWKRRATLFGREIAVDTGRERLRGVADDLDEEGALVLRLGDGNVVRVFAGEVVV